MGEKTGIGWCDHTFNFWYGCHKVSTECKYCYINSVIKRMGKEPFNGPIRSKDWEKPFTWDRKARKAGVQRRVFTCSLSDFFHDGADDWRSEAWDVIRSTKNLDWLVLPNDPS